jgi:hypothetical protein
MRKLSGVVARTSGVFGVSIDGFCSCGEGKKALRVDIQNPLKISSQMAE